MELEGPRTAIAAQLIDLEAALRQLNLWSDEPPSQEALSSEQPFAMDSLEFEEWLQFIFLPTIYEVLDSGSALPEWPRLTCQARSGSLWSFKKKNPMPLPCRVER